MHPKMISGSSRKQNRMRIHSTTPVRITMTRDIVYLFCILWNLIPNCYTAENEIMIGRMCFNCSSEDTQGFECVNSPNVETIVECAIPNEDCVVGLRGPFTVRGCSSDLPDLEMISACQEDSCNYNLHPANRLFCHQCRNCTAPQGGKPTPCLKYYQNDECFIDTADDGRTSRGCKSDLWSSTNYTEFCSQSGCNDKIGVRKITCTSCTTEKDVNCGRIGKHESCSLNITDSCEIEILAGHPQNKVCYTFYQQNNIYRGCIDKTEIPDTEKPYYNFCSTNWCNNKCIPPTKCIHCSTNDIDCFANPKSLPPIPCEKNVCYTCKDRDREFERGCGTIDSRKCTYCKGYKCNDIRPLICYSCNSKFNPNCAQWTEPNATDYEICTHPKSVCGIVVEGGTTVRGCFPPEKLNCDQNLWKCFECSTDLCNEGVFPPNRRRCYMCSKSKECAGDQQQYEPAICPEYHEGNQCFLYADSNNDITRGCTTDVAEMEKCTKAGDLKCKMCADDGCNSTPLMQDPKLSCIKCKDDNCIWGQRAETATKCVNKFPYYLPESCMAQLTRSRVERGCTLDIGACSGLKCVTCKKRGCNRRNYVAQKCVRCSNLNSNETSCANIPHESLKKYCTDPFTLYEQRGCYTKRKGDVVVRGCASELSSKDLEDCKSEHSTCEYCEGCFCNNKKPPNTATSIFISSNGIFLQLLLLCFLS